MINRKGVFNFVFLYSLEYKNEAGGDPPDNPGTTRDTSDDKTFTISSYSTHHITLEGISFYTEEFRIVNVPTVLQQFQSMTLSSDDQFRSTITETSQSRRSSNATDRPADSDVSDCESDVSANGSGSAEPTIYYSEQIMFGRMNGSHNLRIKMKVILNFLS